MSGGPEDKKVEAPLIDQLQAMERPDGAQCWKYATGNVDDPSATGRDSFREVLLIDDLRVGMCASNQGNRESCAQPTIISQKATATIRTAPPISSPIPIIVPSVPESA